MIPKNAWNNLEGILSGTSLFALKLFKKQYLTWKINSGIAFFWITTLVGSQWFLQEKEQDIWTRGINGFATENVDKRQSICIRRNRTSRTSLYKIYQKPPALTASCLEPNRGWKSPRGHKALALAKARGVIESHNWSDSCQKKVFDLGVERTPW